MHKRFFRSIPLLALAGFTGFHLSAFGASEHTTPDLHHEDHAEVAIPAHPEISNPTIHPAESTHLDPQELNNVSPNQGENVESLLRIAKKKISNRLYGDALVSLSIILKNRFSDETVVEALMLSAEAYRYQGDLVKAAAVLEKLLEEFPKSDQVPYAFLELGRIHRQLGASKLALSRFYAVLNVTLKLDSEHMDENQQLARTAQFEIAETHMRNGNYAEAGKYFSRLSLLDLAPEDRARAQFKAAEALFQAKEFQKSANILTTLINTPGVFEDEPEARYRLSLCMQQLGRDDDAISAAMELFNPQRITAQNREVWIYWQRRAGNYLANSFFEKDRLDYARRLYSELASISKDPQWRVPALYQAGLSAEKLGQPTEARNDYETVIRLSEGNESLSEIAAMATWRRDHLDWIHDYEDRRDTYLGPLKDGENSVAIDHSPEEIAQADTASPES